MTFLHDLYEETARRRRRLASRLGPRLAGVIETVLFGGAWLGLAGWILRPWGIAVAPWAVLIPIVSVGVFVLLETRRQQAARLLPATDDQPQTAAARDEAEEAGFRADLKVHGTALLFALLGAATFFWILANDPTPPAPIEPDVVEDGGWTPPPNAPGGELVQ